MREKLYSILMSLTSAPFVTMFYPTIDHLKALAIVMAIDLVVGIYCSFNYELKKFDPKKLRSKGLEVSMFIITLFATLSINVFWKQYGLDGLTVSHYLISAFGFYHFFSILQNMGKMGLPVAGYFQKWIESKAPDFNELKNDEVKNENKE